MHFNEISGAVVFELRRGFLCPHLAQLITLLKLSGKFVGLLINFNVAHLRDGFAAWCKATPCPRVLSG